MARSQFAAVTIGAYLSFAVSPLFAGIVYDQNVTNDVIFGSGVANGKFAVSSNPGLGIELGLRAKVRFPTPENTFHSQGDGFYGSFAAGGPGIGLNTTDATPNWSFEWSINSNYNTSGTNLATYTYQIRIDSDPAVFGTAFLAFDPIHQAYVDSAIGDNSTGNGAGTVAADAAAYAGLIAANNLAQNSWRMEFFFPAFNPNLPGTYTIQLEAYDEEGRPSALTEINVVVGSASAVPEASGLLTWGGLAFGFGLAVGWRKRKTTLAA